MIQRKISKSSNIVKSFFAFLSVNMKWNPTIVDLLSLFDEDKGEERTTGGPELIDHATQRYR